MSVKPNTSFSKKNMKGTSSAMYQRMPQTASVIDLWMTGWLRIRYASASRKPRRRSIAGLPSAAAAAYDSAARAWKSSVISSAMPKRRCSTRRFSASSSIEADASAPMLRSSGVSCAR